MKRLRVTVKRQILLFSCLNSQILNLNVSFQIVFSISLTVQSFCELRRLRANDQVSFHVARKRSSDHDVHDATLFRGTFLRALNDCDLGAGTDHLLRGRVFQRTFFVASVVAQDADNAARERKLLMNLLVTSACHDLHLGFVLRYQSGDLSSLSEHQDHPNVPLVKHGGADSRCQRFGCGDWERRVFGKSLVLIFVVQGRLGLCTSASDSFDRLDCDFTVGRDPV